MTPRRAQLCTHVHTQTHSPTHLVLHGVQHKAPSRLDHSQPYAVNGCYGNDVTIPVCTERTTHTACTHTRTHIHTARTHTHTHSTHVHTYTQHTRTRKQSLQHITSCHCVQSFLSSHFPLQVPSTSVKSFFFTVSSKFGPK